MVALSYDVVIVGSGMGGGTLAYALRESGARVLVVERGDYLPQEPENWSPRAVFVERRYKTSERWEDARGRLFGPGMNYFVGGNSKVYGAALPRFAVDDFEATEHDEGVSPAWPFSYWDLEPYYRRAEEIYLVHGDGDEDGPPRSAPYPYPALEHEPQIAELAQRLRDAGVNPSALPMGIDVRPGGRCIRTRTCDGFPCPLHAKADADVCCVRPALRSPDIELITGATARQVLLEPGRRKALGVEVEHEGTTRTIKAGTLVIACGAANSAVLLLRSKAAHDGGVANSSGVVGRHYMLHNNTALMAVRPLRRSKVEFQKTLCVNDYYARGTDEHPYPLGHVQLIGKLQAEMLAAYQPRVPRPVLRYLAGRSTDWWLFTEDLPELQNRVQPGCHGAVRVTWRPNNVRAHELLVRETRRILRSAGYPIALTRRGGIDVDSHQAGTVRAGTDPAGSALDPWCRSHDVENLYVVDSSFFPSLPPINPALTIAANALRVADRITSVAR